MRKFMKNSLIVVAVIGLLIALFLLTLLATGWLVLFIAHAIGLHAMALNLGNSLLMGIAVYLLITLVGAWIGNHQHE